MCHQYLLYVTPREQSDTFRRERSHVLSWFTLSSGARAENSVTFEDPGIFTKFGSNIDKRQLQVEHRDSYRQEP